MLFKNFLREKKKGGEKMNQLFPYDNIVTGIFIFIVGFLFHWVGQLISVLNWESGTKLGLQEKGLLPEYKVYEHGIAVADVAIGWIYGIAAIGLFLGTPWGFKLAWFPAAVLIYHGTGFWFWTGNRNRAGHQLESNPVRIVWLLANVITGILTILVVWNHT
jgi:hypothetical protein